MIKRNHKSFVFCLLIGIGFGVSGLLIPGCSDNPETKAAKEMRRTTTDAVQTSVEQQDYAGAYDTMMALLQKNRSGGATKDAALLASGNLALAKGRQMQMAWGAKAIALHTDVSELGNVLRDAERVLLEKEQVSGLLASEDQEMAELQSLLSGNAQGEGLNQQLEQVSTQRDELLSQRDSLQAEKKQVQAVLDEQQSSADALLRQAELANGDARLDLERQAFGLLLQRKEHYIKAQTLENEMAALEGEIALIQTKFDGLTQSVQQVQGRIEAIKTSPSRKSLQQQMRDLQNLISDMQQQLTTVSGRIKTEFDSYRKMANEIVAVCTEASSEFEKVASQDVGFTAKARSADSAHHAALICSTLLRTQKDISERLQGMKDTADPMFVSAMAQLPIASGVDTADKDKAFIHYDQAIKLYDEAYAQAGRLDNKAKCNLLNSKLLALYGKMQTADLAGDYAVAESTETMMDEVKQTGAELGSGFTQSETLQIIESGGLNYQPNIPLNVEVLIEGKKEEFKAWKNLPVNEREAVVNSNLQQIDELISQYGEKAALQLETLKQEMLAAKERGFSGGYGDPNSVGSPSYGEPNSL